MAGGAFQAYLLAQIEGREERFLLETGMVCRIGRGEENSVVLGDNLVSRRHALLQCTQGGEYFLVDLGSRNGTLLNGRRVTAPVTLKTGDRISIGSCEIEFQGPPAIAEDKASFGETMLAVSQRLITVLVADIRDFTGLSRRIGEARLSEMMSVFFGECGRVLAEHGAWGQKYIGDAVMAFWVHQRETPERRELAGVFASLAEIFDTAAGLQKRVGLDAAIRIGAGVNTGLASVANIGSVAASDYTAVSEAVNLAFRLETATKEVGCDVVLGEETAVRLTQFADVSQLFDVRTVTLKGYENPMPAYAGRAESVAQLRRILA